MTTIAVFRSRGKITVAATVTLLLVMGIMALQASPAFASDPTLTVNRTGGGTVTSTPSGINCGTDCSETYPVTFTQNCYFDEEIRQVVCEDVSDYQDVTLSASTPSGWSFGGWGGACSGTGSCVVTMDANKTVSASWNDVQDPAVSLTSPTGPYATGIISISANASDNDRVSRVDFYFGGMKVAEDTAAPYSTLFDTVGYNGSALFRAVAVDASGRSAEANRMVTVDNTNPVLNITSGPNGQTFGPGTTQTWNFTPSDAHSGVQSVQCKVERNGSPAVYGACSGGSTSHSVSNLPDGQYNLYVRVTDNVGKTFVGSRIFSIDATAPQTTITSGVADGAATNQTTLTWDFSSSEGGSTFECRVYPAALTGPDFAACSGSGTHTASGFSPGTYTFEVRAIDPYGNTDDTPTKSTFTVDTLKPTVSGMSPRHTSTITDTTPTIKATVRDNLTNLQKANVKLYVNNVLISPTKYSYSASTDVLTYNSPKLSTGKKTVKIVATDAAGNVGTKSWYFTIR